MHGLLEIQTPEIRGPVSYATALHELGHMFGRYQRSRPSLTRERWAWDWPRRHALIWTPATERTAAACLAWYGARERSWPPIPDYDCQPLGYELDFLEQSGRGQAGGRPLAKAKEIAPALVILPRGPVGAWLAAKCHPITAVIG